MDLKARNTAPTEEAALMDEEALEAKGGKKYPLAVAVFRRNWGRIKSLFAFTPEIRRLRNTTNPIERFNRQMRKVTQNRGVNTSDNSVLKRLSLATQAVIKKWTLKITEWPVILAQLAIHFGERVTKSL